MAGPVREGNAFITIQYSVFVVPEKKGTAGD